MTPLKEALAEMNSAMRSPVKEEMAGVPESFNEILLGALASDIQELCKNDKKSNKGRTIEPCKRLR